MSRLRVTAWNGTRPRDGAPLVLILDKKKGLTLISVRGSDRKVEKVIDPVSAKLHKIADGPRSNLTGRALGTWEVDVYGEPGFASFRMTGKYAALGLISWIEKREKKRANERQILAADDLSAANGGTCAKQAVSSVEDYRAYLANLCYRLSYLRGRQSVQEVDAELSAIVEELQVGLGVK